MSKIEVSGLFIYPVKSLSGVALNSSSVDRFGLRDDRRWMVVDDKGAFITQRQQARMCLVRTRLHGKRLKLSAPAMDDIEIDAAGITVNNTAKRTVVVWEDHCEAYDCGATVASWLSEFLQVDCRLVYFPDDGVRQVDQNFARAGDSTAFSDGFPVLLTSEASLHDLNGRMNRPISMRRFRPNIVLRGCAEFAEDRWRRIKIGSITFRVVKPCSRCVIPNIDPDTAERGEEPSRTLIAYRRRDGKVFFGQNIIPDSQGDIHVGMPVEILESE